MHNLSVPKDNTIIMSSRNNYIKQINNITAWYWKICHTAIIMSSRNNYIEQINNITAWYWKICHTAIIMSSRNNYIEQINNITALYWKICHNYKRNYKVISMLCIGTTENAIPIWWPNKQNYCFIIFVRT